MDKEFEHVREAGQIKVYVKGGVLIGFARHVDYPGRDKGKWEAHNKTGTGLGTGTRKECVELVKKAWFEKAGV